MSPTVLLQIAARMQLYDPIKTADTIHAVAVMTAENPRHVHVNAGALDGASHFHLAVGPEKFS